MSAARTDSPEKIAKCAEAGRTSSARHDALCRAIAETFNTRTLETEQAARRAPERRRP